MTCKPRPRMATVADALAEWNGGGTLNAPSESESGGLNLGSVFIGGLLVAAAVAGVVEYRKKKQYRYDR
jgi:hypothetical protein